MRKKDVNHDESPAIIRDHAFEPRDEWYTLCRHCGLAMPAHKETKINVLTAIKDEHIKKHRKVRYASDAIRERALEVERLHKGGLARIGYYSDDNPTDE